MAYERVYAKATPCPCGKGTAKMFRVEHDTWVNANDTGHFDGPEIDCEVCDPEKDTHDIPLSLSEMEEKQKRLDLKRSI